MTKRLNNEGFSLLGILFVILVLVAVGGVGWFVYVKQHKTTTGTVTASSAPPKTKSGGTSAPPASPVQDPYAGWKTYTSKLTGATMKYPSDWSGNPSPYTMVANNGATYETMTLSSPYVSFEGQQVGAQIIFETGSAPVGCDASRNDSVYKTTDFGTQGNSLSVAQLINQSGKIYFLQLVSTANLASGGTVIPNCSEQVKLAGGKTLDVTAEFVTPCAAGSHCADVINPLTPQQYNDYPLVSQVVDAFKSITFN